MNILEKKEFSSLLITLMSVKLLLSYPIKLIKNSGNAAWIQVIFVTLIALAIFRFTTKIYEQKVNVIELVKIHTNKTLKIITGLLVFTVLLLNMITVVRIFPESVKIVLLQDTDTDIILAIFILTVFIGAKFGIESIAKINYIFLPICGILMLAFVLFLIPYYKLDNIFPILGKGIKNVFVSGISGLSIFSDIIILNILLAYSKNIAEVKKVGNRAIIISGAVGVLITFTYALIYPHPVSEEFILPVYQMTRIMHLGSFFNRFEAIFQFLWSILMFLYGAVYLYIMCFVWQITFSLKYIKPLMFPVALLVSSIAIIPESIMEADTLEGIFENITFPVAFLLPIAVGLLDRQKRKSDEKEAVS